MGTPLNELSEQDLEKVRAAVTAGGEFDDDLVERVIARLPASLELKDGVAERQLTALLDRQLREPRDPSTWPSIEASLITLLDDEASALFLSWVFTDPSGVHLAALKRGQPDAAAVVQRIRATFGPEIDAATRYMQLGVDDWMRVDRLAYTNNETGLQSARTTITKVNGETMQLEGSPTSLMALVRILLEGVLAFGTPEAFSDLEREDFVQTLEAARSMLAASADGVVLRDGKAGP